MSDTLPPLDRRQQDFGPRSSMRTEDRSGRAMFRRRYLMRVLVVVCNLFSAGATWAVTDYLWQQYEAGYSQWWGNFYDHVIKKCPAALKE